MPVQDLINGWEEALTQALSPTERDELAESDLEAAAGVALRSSLRAGDSPSLWNICHTGEYNTCGCAIP